MVKQISLMPPNSVSFTESTSTFQRRASAYMEYMRNREWAYMEYMRNREWANRAASSPPTPARISTITFLSSFGSRGSRSTLISSSSRAMSSLGIPGQQEHLDLLLQPGHVLLGLVELLLGQLLHVRVAHQRLGVRQILPAALVGPVGSDHRLQLPLLLVELRHQGGVVIGLRRAKPGLHIRVVEIQRA